MKRAITTSPEDPFTLVSGPVEEESGFSPLFLGLCGLCLVAGFFAALTFHGDFTRMRQYGVDDTGNSFIFSLSDGEKLFAVVLLLLLPAVGFLTLGLEKRLGGILVSRLDASLTKAKGRRRIIALLMALSLAVSSWIAFGVLKGSVISDDENVYLQQTRILASGHLTLPSLVAEDRVFNDNIFWVNNGRLFGQYPFGHAFFLIPGALLGEPRIMILLAAVFSVLGIYRLGRELFDAKTGMLAALLLSFSPMFLCMSGTLLSHPTAMLFLIWYGVFAARTLKNPGIRDALLAGLFFSLAFHIRGATTVLVAGPSAAVLAFTLFFDAKSTAKPRFRLAVDRNFSKILALCLIIGGVVGSYFLLNFINNGSPFITNYHAAWLGKLPFKSPFGFDRGAWNIIHTPTAGLMNTVNNFLRLNVWLFGWPVGFLAPAFLFLRRPKVSDWILILPVLLSFAAYFFYFWPGISDTGPVLYYELLAPLSILGARGIFCAVDVFSATMPRGRAAGRVAVFVGLSILLAQLSTTQVHIRALEGLATRVNEPYELLQDREIDEGLVFMDFYVKGDYQDSWVAGRKNTSPALGDKLHFVLNMGAERNRRFSEKYFPNQAAHVLWWEEGEPRLVDLMDYQENYVVRNYPEAR